MQKLSLAWIDAAAVIAWARLPLPVSVSIRHIDTNQVGERIHTPRGFTLHTAIVLSVLAFALAPAFAARVPNTTLRMPAEFPIVGYGMTNAFGDVTFEQPIAIASPPGETNRLFIAERTGRIMLVTNLAAPTKTEFIDLRLDELVSNFVESGLLGLAFHPGYATNGYFFVYRTIMGTTDGATFGLHDEVARFQVDPLNPNRALPESKTRILAQHDINEQHNAGDLQFGPDGYLYISIGDSAPPPGSQPHLPQAIDEHFFGSILRIDVDKRPGNLAPNPLIGSTTNYFVPADNPFVTVTEFNELAVDPARIRSEIYAVGLRNPWRINFDSVTGDLYCADVGADKAEEVNLIVPGGNYGWPFLEGNISGPNGLPVPRGFLSRKPLYAYAHGSGFRQGGCIIGGLVYRGNGIPQLQGAYVFGDHRHGRIWALRQNVTNGVTVEYVGNHFNLTTFGIDPRNRDVLAANLDGQIVRITYRAPEEAVYPRTLVDTGAFADLKALEPNPGIVSYDINVPFWSDNAIKTRWFSLPADATIGFSASNNWLFPFGTVWIKHFELEMTNGVPSSSRRIETRFLVKTELGVYGLTYRWGSSKTNAALVPEEGMEEEFTIRDRGTTRIQTWYYPGRADCLRCHTPQGGYAIGFNTAQLNRSIQGKVGNQIESLSAAAYFDREVGNIRSHPVLADATNSAWPIQYRFRSYLAANCAQCHYPGGPPAAAPAYWDARFTKPISEAHIVNAPSAYYGEPWRIIKPGDLDNSLLLHKINGSFGVRMPPLATSVLDSDAIALVTEYVQTLPKDPWLYQDIGSTGREGSSSISDAEHYVSGSGTNIGGASDQFHFLHQPLIGNSHFIARVVSAADGGKAGVTFRESTVDSARYILLAVHAGQGRWQFRSQPGQQTVEATHSSAKWLRIVREGTTVSGFISDDGSQWTQVGSAPWFGTNLLAGLASSSLDNAILHNVAFDQVSTLTVALTKAASSETLLASDTVGFEAQVAAQGAGVKRVEFYNHGEKIGQAITAPYRFQWTNLTAGDHSITARAVDARGNGVASEPVLLSVKQPPARSLFSKQNAFSLGNWRGRYGKNGSIIAGNSTNLPDTIHFEMSGAPVNDFPLAARQTRALRKATGAGRTAAVWQSPTNFSVNLSLFDGELQSVSLYFVDFDWRNQRVQNVEVFDLESGELLESRIVSRFSRGIYVTFFVRGSVQFRISRVSGPDAVLGAIFIDPAAVGTSRLRIASGNGRSRFTLPTNILLTATVIPGKIPLGGAIEFYAHNQKIGEVSSPPYSVLWRNPFPGTYSVVARSSDVLGTTIQSPALTVNVDLPPPRAKQVAIDLATEGNWQGRYGTDGYAIAAHATNVPVNIDLSFGSPNTFVWDYHSADPRALLREDSPAGIISIWYSSQFTIDVAPRDGSNRVVSLYFLDVNGGTIQQIEIIDPATGELLDQRKLQTFAESQYISWSIQGHVRFRFTAILGHAFVSGFFLDHDQGNGLEASHAVPLAITRFGESVQLSWPAIAPEMVLQSKDLFEPSSEWVDVPNPRTLVGDNITVHDGLHAPGKFYRLVGPPP
jgi:glucose/arabinose dehydrogenase